MLFFAALVAVGVASLGMSQMSEDYMDWIVKSVCADDAGRVYADDPFFGCPDGTLLRKIRAGDIVPYNNFEQMGYQICDSYVILDKVGQFLYFHNFDYEPFNTFNQFSGSDGYDVYSIDSKTVSISNTMDGGGYGSTFFGEGCSYGNGWALFPTSNFLQPSQDYWPISGVYWEHNAQSAPGDCPSSYSTNTLTSWETQESFSFGGINGNPVKLMPTLVSYHGFETERNGYTPTDNFLANGHLEVFYYTELYGLTRWEVWVPKESYLNSNATGVNTDNRVYKKNKKYGPRFTSNATSYGVTSSSECSGNGSSEYKGISFVVTDCHDWSRVVASSGILPAWPVVNANLLAHPHFEAKGFSDSCQSNAVSAKITHPRGGSSTGVWCRYGDINWSALVSTGGGDASDGGSGVAYLATNCAGADPAPCGVSGSMAVYQDISVDESTVSMICDNCTYLVGVNARREVDTGTGTILVTVQLLGEQNSFGEVAVLWETQCSGEVQEDNGDGRGSETDSVYLSSAFVHCTVTLPVLTSLAGTPVLAKSLSTVNPGFPPGVSFVNSTDTAGAVTRLRFLVQPLTPGTFHVAGAFFNRFPSTKVGSV
jgi:hypothetical protein